MAEYSTRFSTTIECTQEQYDWLVNLMRELVPDNLQDPRWHLPCDISYGDGAAWLRDSNGTCDIDATAEILRGFLEEFHPASYYWIEWADVCSEPIPGSFTGGGVLITEELIKYFRPSEIVEGYIDDMGLEYRE